jgi:zinc-ribbon domain
MAPSTVDQNLTKFCSQCGNSLISGSKFCNHCGSAVPVLSSQGFGNRLSNGTEHSNVEEIAELERLVADHPEDQSYQNLLAVQLHDDALKNWWKDPKDGQYLCTSVAQIKHARIQLDRANALNFADPNLRSEIEKTRQLVNRMEAREYTGNWFQVVILGIFYIFPGVIWWLVNRRPAFLVNRDYMRHVETGKHTTAGAKMGGAMEKVSNFFDSVTGGWGGFFALAFMVIFSPIFMILAFKQNYLDIQKEYENN